MKRMLYSFIVSLLILTGSDVIVQSQNNLDKGMRYVEENAEKWGLVETDYSGVMVNDMYTNNKTGITYIYLTQGYKGIPIQNAITPVIISPNGKVNVVRHGFIANIKEKIKSTTPTLEPLAAIKSAVNHLELQASSMPSLKKSLPEKNIYEFGKADFADNEIAVKLTYINVDNNLHLAWTLAIDEKEDNDYYNLFVDAQSGQVIEKFNFTQSCTFHKGQYDRHVGCNHDKENKTPVATFEEASMALNTAAGSYNVLALPIESPIHGERTMETDPHFTDGSPFGWHDVDGVEGAEYTITRGNNVHAFLDKDDDNTSLGDEPDGGEALNFDYQYDVDAQTFENEQAVTVNLFYMSNMIHDISNRLGFDEQSGNFQQSNYGSGGAGGDYVIAKSSAAAESSTTQTGPGAPIFNNADFSTLQDGVNGRMGMFLWDNPSGVLSIDEPEELAGFIEGVVDATGTDGFGGPIPLGTENPISGKIVVATDAIPGEETKCCGEISNPEEIAGNIALIDRGICDFSLKAYNAEQAGAISVIICNVEGGSQLGGMEKGDQAENVSIVPLFIEKADCDRIRASLLSDIDVRMTIQNRPPIGPDQLDGSMDNGIIAHEYAHGISNRLVGGRLNTNCLTSDEQMGEGISDYFTLILTTEEGDSGEDPRGIGNYADAQSVAGGGIRRFPYSTDMNINPQVYDDIKTSNIDPGTGKETSEHQVGEIWASVLWDIHWQFIDAYGLDISWEDEESGNFKAARMIIEGMKMGPCNPSFIDARDAILEADSVLYNAENSRILWESFARRGLGYLADHGVDSNDKTDGTQNFDPFPLVIQSLKIQEKSPSLVKPGEELVIELTAQNHIPETQTGVVITSNIPDGLTYVEGSSSMPATLDNGVLTIAIGDMAFEDEVMVSYKAIADQNIKSETLFYDDIDNADLNEYDFGALVEFNLWFQSTDVANSGEVSMWASQPDPELEYDFWMNTPSLLVAGDQPAFRFYHRYDTEAGADGGFIQVSRDGGTTYQDVKDKFLRNGYPTSIQYITFAIPLLEGFSGSTDEKFIASYLDLSDYKGEEVIIRFRFGADENTAPESELRGWYVDDVELIDLVQYEAHSCITSDSSEEQCSNPIQIIIDTDGTVGTNEKELEGFNINISPNPASDYLTLAISAEKNTPVVVQMMSIDGKIAKTISMVARENASVRTFDTSELESGMYLIQVQSETGMTTRKVIIQ